MAISDYIYEKPVIKTERLLLRPMSSSDIPALTQWLSDTELYTYWGKGPSRAEKDPKLLFEKTGAAGQKLSSWHRNERE